MGSFFYSALADIPERSRVMVILVGLCRVLSGGAEAAGRDEVQTEPAAVEAV